MKSLCIYCGSKFGNNTVYNEAAQWLGKFCAENQIRIIYGGGRVGLMGSIADTALDYGGEVIGIIPQHLVDWEVAHTKLTDLKVVQTMHERKAVMAELSDAFLAMPGGFGTLDELFEITTWSQLRLHQKPIALWNVDSYFNHLINFIKQCQQEGFVSDTHVELIQHSTDAVTLLRKLGFVSN